MTIEGGQDQMTLRCLVCYNTQPVMIFRCEEQQT